MTVRTVWLGWSYQTDRDRHGGRNPSVSCGGSNLPSARSPRTSCSESWRADHSLSSTPGRCGSPVRDADLGPSSCSRAQITERGFGAADLWESKRSIPATRRRLRPLSRPTTFEADSASMTRAGGHRPVGCHRALVTKSDIRELDQGQASAAVLRFRPVLSAWKSRAPHVRSNAHSRPAGLRGISPAA